jgi:hypothetical protein
MRLNVCGILRSAQTDELIEELKRRYELLLVVGKEKSTTDKTYLTCICHPDSVSVRGLAEVAEARTAMTIHEFADTETEADFGEENSE